MHKEPINGFTYFEKKQDALNHAGIQGKNGKDTPLKKVWPDPEGGYWASKIAGHNPVAEILS